jgi:hypothetical protein
VNTIPIISQILAREELTVAQTAGMYRLLARYFDGVTPEQFRRDLAEKNRVILLTRGDEIVGFSTVLAYETSFDGSPVSVICSGDTIVAQDAWGTSALPRAWIASVTELRADFPRGPYYWMLLTSGFRTYRFLPLFWREFYPCFERSTPPDTQRLLTQLASERFGSQFDAATGLVRFTVPQRLRGELSAFPQGRAPDAHVQFFFDHNPRHTQGDELVCLTSLDQKNLTSAGRRMLAPALFETGCHHR